MIDAPPYSRVRSNVGMAPIALLVVMAISLVGATAPAANVDLTTLPRRSTVQLTIYNSEDITLVRETRFITLKKGANKLQFSWAGTLIDPSSVEFRALEHAAEIDLADTVFPGQKPQHLIWNINSQFEGQVPVEVTYFTSGLSWQMDYVAITDPEETTMQFTGHVRVSNNSGEEYEDAQVRLIVGTINLVEKIAELAQRRGIPVPGEADKLKELQKEVYRFSIDAAEKKAQEGKDDDRMPASAPKAIVKEGLSEYFMFSVDGTETIRNGWSKRMRAVKVDQAKFDIVYRMREYQYGPRPVRFYTWRNDDQHKLGDSPLPDGLVRVFRDTGRDGLSFLSQQQIRYVPIKADIELNLGPDDLVVYDAVRADTERLNFHFRQAGNREWVDGWDERTKWTDTIRNYRGKPIKFELRRIWPGHVDYETETPTKLFDYRTAEVTLDVPALGKVVYPATVTTHHGANAKQQRIELKERK
ncbi:MAG: hypothetical protein K8T91_04650 [Planctomycetes bacterium]|nr:hypothetical protein [Planctomycetota bacterium]